MQFDRRRKGIGRQVVEALTDKRRPPGRRERSDALADVEDDLSPHFDRCARKGSRDIQIGRRRRRGRGIDALIFRPALPPRCTPPKPPEDESPCENDDDKAKNQGLVC